MDAEKLGQVLAAFDLLAEDAGGSLDEKPNVADVKAQGVDVNADERDEAWEAYAAKAEAEMSPEPAGDMPMVTNNHSSRLTVRGVTIPAGETRPVPKLGPDSAKVWRKTGLISVS